MHLAKEENKDPGNLKLIISSEIQNDETLGVVARCLQEDPMLDPDGNPPEFGAERDCAAIYWDHRLEFSIDRKSVV